MCSLSTRGPAHKPEQPPGRSRSCGRGSAALWLELAALAGWAAWVGREFLDPYPDTWPIGGDFPLTLQPYYAWELLPRCGLCFLWNGGINGGYPALAELHGAFLHPLVALPILALGVLYGAKLSFVLSLFLAGLGQWWLGRALGLGRPARLWAGAMAIAGGHLAGRMQLGLSALVLSAASAGLVLAALVELSRTGSRRSAVLLGLGLALTLVSGQGYVQVGLALAILPASLILVIKRRPPLPPLFRRLVLAGGLGLLLAAVFLIPLAHFAPHLSKLSDPALAGAEPLWAVPLNLVIRDASHYGEQYGWRAALPALYINYIGWIPIGLGLVAVLRPRGIDRRSLWFLVAALGLVFFLGSESFLRLAAALSPGFAAAYRYPSLVTVLAGTLVLALAGRGLQGLVDSVRTGGAGPSERPRQLFTHLGHAVLLALAVVGLASVYDFGRQWLWTYTVPPVFRRVSQALHREGTGWISPPVGHEWAPYLLDEGNKVTLVYRPWQWADRVPPFASFLATQDPHRMEENRVILTFGDTAFVEDRRFPYAQVETASGSFPCQAEATGGEIRVVCDVEAAGVLVVQENNYDGWSAWQAGQRLDLLPGQWLSVRAEAGPREYRLRYRPWDAIVGGLLSLIGLILSGWLWWSDRRPVSAEAAGRHGSSGPVSG